MRLFLDANVLFSAAWKEDASARLLFELDAAGFCRLTTSRLAVEEARQNILRKRPERGSLLEELIGRVVVGREPAAGHLEQAGHHGLPAKDIPILAAAIAQRADRLVTGDRRDFGHLYGKRIKGIRIVGLNEAIKQVLAEGRQ